MLEYINLLMMIIIIISLTASAYIEPEDNPIYTHFIVISLPDSERRSVMSQKLKEYDVTFEFFDGVIATKDDIKQYKIPPWGIKEWGSVGCTLAHLNACKYAYDKGYDNVFILEDDAKIIDENFKVFIKRPSEFINQSPINIVCREAYNGHGFVGYIINREGMEIMEHLRDNIIQNIIVGIHIDEYFLYNSMKNNKITKISPLSLVYQDPDIHSIRRSIDMFRNKGISFENSRRILHSK
jgi:hypothetical protein